MIGITIERFMPASFPFLRDKRRHRPPDTVCRAPFDQVK